MYKEEEKKRKKKLIDLGAEALADALLNLSYHSDMADDVIENLIATPKENLLSFKEKLSKLKQSRRFIDWRGASAFSRELEMVLQNLKSGVDDPVAGLESVVSFFEADEAIFERCDDSGGYIGDVFCGDAKELFVDYASRCKDKEKVADIILTLNQEDGYGVRRVLIDCAGECLPEDTIRYMISILQSRADKEREDHNKRRHWIKIESLAKQIKDTELFKNTRLRSWGKLNAAAHIDIARDYLENGDLEKALSQLNQIQEENRFRDYERNQMLREIYEKQGDTEKLSEFLYERFRARPTADSLKELLDVVGRERRDELVREAVPGIMETDRFVSSDAGFLIDMGKIDEAEAYLLKRADQLDGEFYGHLLPLAESMESGNRYLAAGLIYRSLLLSILERGYTKAYSHGVGYLKKLDKLSESVNDWKGFMDHTEFKAQIIQAHGRKRSFWSKYEGK